MHNTVVIDVVGLTRALIGEYTPNLQHFLNAHSSANIEPVIPAVTCTA